MSLKVVSVYGASGVQGLSVVKSLLDDYKVRALTRSAEKLKDLSHPNLTVVEVDIENTASLAEAFKGSWAVFANTFTDYEKPEGTEARLGKIVVDAVVAAGGIEWFLWSGGLPGMPSRAWAEKAEVVVYAQEKAKQTGLKNVWIGVGCYMSNFYIKPAYNSESGFVEFTLGSIDEKTYFPLVSTSTDLGPVVKGVLANPDEWDDQEIPIVGDPLTFPEMAAVYSKVFNIPARAVFNEDHPLNQIPIFKDVLLNFKNIGYYPNYFGREKELPVRAKKLYPGMKTYEEWLRETGRLDEGPKA